MKNTLLFSVGILLSSVSFANADTIGLSKGHYSFNNEYTLEQILNAQRGGTLSLRSDSPDKEWVGFFCTDELATTLENCQEFSMGQVSELGTHNPGILISHLSFQSSDFENWRSLKAALKKNIKGFKVDLGTAEDKLKLTATRSYIITGLFAGTPGVLFTLVTSPVVVSFEYLSIPESLLLKMRMKAFYSSVIENNRNFKMRLKLQRMKTVYHFLGSN